MQKRKLTISVVVLLILIALVVVRPGGRWYTNNVLDNREHYISCQQLPTVAEVEKVMSEHRDELEQLTVRIGSEYADVGVAPRPVWNTERLALSAMHDGKSSFEITYGEQECRGTGRGDIKVWYMKHKDRERIENTWGDTFYGIPYRGQNI